MTDSALPRFPAKSNFNVGQVFNRTSAIFSRNLLPFCLINLVCGLPNALIYAPRFGLVSRDSATLGLMFILGGLGTMILGTISQAVILNAAFDDMRGRPVDFGKSISHRSAPLLSDFGRCHLRSVSWDTCRDRLLDSRLDRRDDAVRFSAGLSLSNGSVRSKAWVAVHG